MDAFRKGIETLSIDTAEFEIKRMENSIRQLGVTEKSLQEAIDDEATDSDDRQLYEETIAENNQLLKKIEMRIDILLQHIKNLKLATSDHAPRDNRVASQPLSSTKTEETAEFKEDAMAGLIL